MFKLSVYCWCCPFAHHLINWRPTCSAKNAVPIRYQIYTGKQQQQQPPNSTPNNTKNQTHFSRTASRVPPFLSFLSDVQVGQPRRGKKVFRAVEILLRSHLLFICPLTDAKDVVPKMKSTLTVDSLSILCVYILSCYCFSGNCRWSTTNQYFPISSGLCKVCGRCILIF